MKGVILSLNPAARLVDLTHAVPPQDIRHGAIVLDEVTPWFPADTIHVAVVDPGVGSSRKIIYARIGHAAISGPRQRAVEPFGAAAAPSTIIHVAKADYWLPRVSATFHGRDIFAPVAAHLSLGVAPGGLGRRGWRDLVTLDWAEAVVSRGKIEGVIESIDSFGNLISNITADQLADVPARRGNRRRVRRAPDPGHLHHLFRSARDDPDRPGRLQRQAGTGHRRRQRQDHARRPRRHADHGGMAGRLAQRGGIHRDPSERVPHAKARKGETKVLSD